MSSPLPYRSAGGGYSHRPPPISPRNWSATRWLITLNVIIYLLQICYPPVANVLGFTRGGAIGRLQIWRFLTFQFIHFSPFHLLINMIVLYFFGPIVEDSLGKTRFTLFYLICGLAGAGSFLLLGKVGLLPTVPDPLLGGASAGIYGVMVAAACIIPHRPVDLVFILIPAISIQLRNLVLIFLAIAVVVVISSGTNAGGEAAHLGGAAMGYLLIKSFGRLGPQRRSSRFWRPGKANFLRDEFRK